MKHWERFKTYKQRGEWVELEFMAEAAGVFPSANRGEKCGHTMSGLNTGQTIFEYR